MKKSTKKMLVGAVAIALAGGAYLNYQQACQAEYTSNLTLADLEANGGILDDLAEWWDRPDYDCITIICRGIGYEYPATVSRYVGNGQGSMAHQWGCGTGC